MSQTLTVARAIPAVLCLIFRRALVGKLDDRTVKVQAVDLLSAFGADRCKKEFGFDVDHIENTVQQTVDNRLAELELEIAELQDYVSAGFQDARKMLKSARHEPRDILSGALRPKPLIPVLVGKLRRLVAETDQQTKQTEPKSPAPQPTARVKPADPSES